MSEHRAGLDSVVVGEPALGSRSEQAKALAPGTPRWLRPLRDAVHRLPAGRPIWKIAVAVIGGAVVALGIVLIPFPGPGWAVVFLGVAIWATEFVWARRLLGWGRLVLRRWTDWIRRQPLWGRALLAVAALACLAGVLYVSWILFF
ncbi:TIGR02611 family protein [Jatrophihabitans telluris]|uniref:TIGR02611 family protein n=1 Tax=Jatrophihabitans telluris TaxID=2038343 RepID=A0ABY4QTX5_9ACTN|nr:TIGR02611 family protein [Jatrophihabitans telluris]UQX86888.1 TIGR02611 family protein [Jatrophihabitans telluris]